MTDPKIEEIERDSKKERKTAFLWLGLFLLLAASVFFFFSSHRVLNEADLQSKTSLILSSDPITGKWGKGAESYLKFNFKNLESSWYVASEGYACSSEYEILANFKKGDTVSIQVNSSETLNENPTIYGLVKNGKNYIDLNCVNKLSVSENKAFFKSSLLSLILCMFLLIFFKRVKLTGDFSYLQIDPVFIVAIFWIILYFIFK